MLIYIDDATSRILYGKFVSSEDTLNLMHATKDYLLLHGRPLSFYVDKDSIYKINRQATVEEELKEIQPLTQFTRAMTELGIEVIAADSPQAKGRVERSFGTHQDRLVKELRLAGISTIEDANKFLMEIYIPKHNAKYARNPLESGDAHRVLLPNHCLEEILSIRTPRVLSQDWCLRFQNKFFQVSPKQEVRPRDRILVEIRLDNSIHLRFKEHYLDFKELKERPYRSYYDPIYNRSVLAALNQGPVLEDINRSVSLEDKTYLNLFPNARFDPLAKMRKMAHRDFVLGTH